MEDSGCYSAPLLILYIMQRLLSTHFMSGSYTVLLEGCLAGQDHIVTSIIEERLEEKKKREHGSRQKLALRLIIALYFDNEFTIMSFINSATILYHCEVLLSSLLQVLN